MRAKLPDDTLKLCHGQISDDVCGAVGAKTCYFYLDRRLDAAGSMDDEMSPMDLCDVHQWAAYKIAEKKSGFELANHVFQELQVRVLQTKEKRNAALALLPK